MKVLLCVIIFIFLFFIVFEIFGMRLDCFFKLEMKSKVKIYRGNV